MEFFNNVGVDTLKPSLFELVSQEQLRELLQPALKYVLAVFAQRYPRYILRIVNRHEEFYAILMFIVERHYLKNHGASFSENFYGLKRRRRPYIEAEREKAATGGVPAGEKLRRREIWRSLLFLVGVPYLRAKTQDYFEDLGGGISSDVLNDGADVRQVRMLTDQSFKGWLRRTYKTLYPWCNAGFEVWLLAYNVAYLFDQTPFYRPWLAWMGVDLRRLGIEDLRAASMKAAQNAPDAKGRGLRQLLRSSPQLLLDSLRLLLPTAVFFIKFLEWWYSPGSPARSLSTSPLGPAVPPPCMLPPHPQGIPFDTQKYGICPLCQRSINNATALPSGYVFCYRCAYDHIEKHGKCPITLLPSRVWQLRKVLFGKHIQSHQVPGWSAYYLDYKFLKKIISSLAANRPASEAAALALGLRPVDFWNQSSTPGEQFSASLEEDPGRPPIFSESGLGEDRGLAFRAHKAAFFFKLERELEKINAFYLQKEAELQLRLETLLSKRRAAAMRGLPDSVNDTTQSHVEWSAVEEGFRLLERDLGKLQQFVEINATGFRKILKKFDKRSKSTTKELYLARQVDVQPVFNRQLISELSDTVAACLLDITDLSSGLKFEGPGANDIFMQQLMTERTPYVGPFHDLEKNLRKAVTSADPTAIRDCVRYSDVLSQETGTSNNVARILWNVIIEAPPEFADLILSSLSSPFDFHFIDDINGRTCLHEAAMAGAPRLVNLCIEKQVLIDKVDVYGRTALHYAAMNGHAAICRLLMETGLPLNNLDIDNYSPLVYATLRGCVECVEVLLEHEIPPQPATPGGDLIPLSLASQCGYVDIIVLLLKRGAKCLPNSNGEYPMHLAAREGHAEVCKILLHHDGWDTPDKYHEWTPLFHASRYGHEACVSILLEAGSRVFLTDELGHLPVLYAAWYGHHECLNRLLEASARVPAVAEIVAMPDISPNSDQDGHNREFEIDMIPSLSLPPPIMPHRVYGHNYLDRSHLVQVTVGNTSRNQTPSVRLHHRLLSPAFRDEYLLKTAPLKLVITTKSPEVNSAPYSISLPQRDEKGVFIFQIPNLNCLCLEFSIYPNFGTKTIGRAVALPSLFTDIENNQSFTLPIMDNRLHVVGEVTFEVNIITSFNGVTLEVGGDVETYWKSTISSIQQPVSMSPYRSGLAGSTQTSPSTHSISGAGSQSLTISSLRGKYLYVTVQVTRDSIPVVFSHWRLPESNFNLSVCDVTLAQFETLAERLGRNVDNVDALSVTDWPAFVFWSMMSLSQLLKILPPNIGISLELAYPSPKIRERYCLSRLDLNSFVDSVLRTIYYTSTPDGRLPRRRIVFTSFSPDVCAALNWKQPNYPVFFASHCGKKDIFLSSPSPFTLEDEDDGKFCSLGEAVEFARINNLLGVIVDADLLLQVPSLVQGIKNVGLLAGIHGTSDRSTPLTTVGDGSIDAYLSDGFAVYLDHSMQEI
ncbi:cyclin-dependent protein kinase inhibitor [Desarmillaria ectypa]|nr:cyclin-dependent protein kinase inhibitor [Desarmillaria ectypa]